MSLKIFVDHSCAVTSGFTTKRGSVCMTVRHNIHEAQKVAITAMQGGCLIFSANTHVEATEAEPSASTLKDL